MGNFLQFLKQNITLTDFLLVKLVGRKIKKQEKNCNIRFHFSSVDAELIHNNHSNFVEGARNFSHLQHYETKLNTFAMAKYLKLFLFEILTLWYLI